MEVEKSSEKTINEVQYWIKRQLRDPITKILLPKSSLTEIQLNTLLLDLMTDSISHRKLTYREKATLRRLKVEAKNEGKKTKRKVVSTADGVSRGAFNRVLRQARRNVIRSVYTIILLGYLGIFEEPKLQPYLVLAKELREYVKTYEEVWNKHQKRKTKKSEMELLRTFQEHIKELVQKLGDPLALKEGIETDYEV
ncbi:MAG: hypothetical protein ACFFBS_02170 [Promethearchaeota archaeon]